MQAAMAQMSVQSASGGIELFSIGPHTKPGALPHLRKPKTLNLSWLRMSKKCGIWRWAYPEDPYWVTSVKDCVIIFHVEGGDN